MSDERELITEFRNLVFPWSPEDCTRIVNALTSAVATIEQVRELGKDIIERSHCGYLGKDILEIVGEATQ